MTDPAEKVPADLFFEVVDPQRHGIAKFAKLHGWSVQRVSNWRRRGIPFSALPRVAAYMGITVEEYLERSGGGITFRVMQNKSQYNAGQLWRDYRSLDEISRQIVDDIFARARSGKKSHHGD